MTEQGTEHKHPDPHVRRFGGRRGGFFWQLTAGERPSATPKRSARKGVVWGLFLVGLGVVLLLDQIGALRIDELGPWWPAIVVAVGLAKAAAGQGSRRISEGIAWVLIGIWCFAVTRHWYGLSYLNGWPVLVVIWGFQLVLAALLDGLLTRKEEEHGA